MTKKKEIIKEFYLARAIAILCMIAVHAEYAIYNYNDEVFGKIIDYLGSPFAAPIFMFILGANIVLSSKSEPKKLLVRGISLLATSFIFNIICHALPFFIIDYKLGAPSSVENSLHWIFAVDILTFAGIAFIFFSAVKKFKISNKTLCIFALCASILNTILIKNFQIDFNTYPLLAAITSLFYGSSITGYFSFLGWIVFPIAGYIFIQKLINVKNKDKFYLKLGITNIIIYAIMVIGSFTIFKDSPLIVFNEEYSYYWMNPYQAIANIAFCLGWLSILYYATKIIPSCIKDDIERLNKNLTSIYLIQWFIINYVFVLPLNGQFKVGKLGYIIIIILIIIVSDTIAYLNNKYKSWKLKENTFLK